MSFRVLLSLSLVALILAGCGSSTPPPSPHGESPSRLRKGMNRKSLDQNS